MINPEQLKTAIQTLLVAHEKLRAAEELFKARCYNDSISRSYYAAFHMVSMLLYLDGKTFSRHNQVLGNFNKDYIATGLLTKELSKMLGNLFDERQSADYDVFVSADMEEAKQGLMDATYILEEIKNFTEQRFDISLNRTDLP